MGSPSSRSVAVIFSILLLSLAAIPAAYSEGIQPNDFMVEVNDMGPGEPNNDKPDCTPVEDGTFYECTNKFSETQSNHSAKGTVNHIPTNTDGAITLVCDFSMNNTTKVRVPATGTEPNPDEIQLISMTGTGLQVCSWQMEFNDSEHSSLNGKIEGKMEMGKLNENDLSDNKIYVSGRFDVEAVSGTGKFDSMVGAGSFCHYEEFNFTEGPGEQGPPDDEACPSSASTAAQVATAASESDSNMDLKLKRGKFRAAVASYLKKLKRGDKISLRVATASKATCKASARQGSATKSLGSAKASSEGVATFKGALAKKLGKGKWKVSTACRKGNTVAKDNSTVTVS